MQNLERTRDMEVDELLLKDLANKWAELNLEELVKHIDR